MIRTRSIPRFLILAASAAALSLWLASGGPTVAQDALKPEKGSGLGSEPWRGLDITTVETLLAAIDIPPRSPAMNALWRRLIRANAAPPTGGDSPARFAAWRAEALYRSGIIGEIDEVFGKTGLADPLAIVVAARGEIGAGSREKACTALQGVAQRLGELPALPRRDAILALGYCALAAGDTAAAGLSAEMARENGLTGSPGLDVLDAIAAGGEKPKSPFGQRISVIDYRLLEAAGIADIDKIAANASPALLAVIAGSRSTAPATKLVAGEAAARLNILSPDELARIYGEQARRGAADNSVASTARNGKAARRAALFVAADAERNPARKGRAIRDYLDEARASGDYVLALRTVTHQLDALRPSPDLAWFAETAIEIGLAGQDTERVLAWVESGPSRARRDDLEHWLALVDILDPAARSRRGANLAVVEELAHRGVFSPEGLHRLATVLDALDYHVPVRLWDVASRTPQPDGGHLPETSVLSGLADAAKKREIGRVALLVLATLGPNGAEGAHVIALGDALRALMRAGLGDDAHRLGFEALFAFWPRSVTLPADEGNGRG